MFIGVTRWPEGNITYGAAGNWKKKTLLQISSDTNTQSIIMFIIYMPGKTIKKRCQTNLQNLEKQSVPFEASAMIKGTLTFIRGHKTLSFLAVTFKS